MFMVVVSVGVGWSVVEQSEVLEVFEIGCKAVDVVTGKLGKHAGGETTHGLAWFARLAIGGDATALREEDLANGGEARAVLGGEIVEVVDLHRLATAWAVDIHHRPSRSSSNCS